MRLVLVGLLFLVLVQNGFGASINIPSNDEKLKPLIPRVFEEPLNETLYCLRILVNMYFQTIDIEELNLNFDILEIEDLGGNFNINNMRITDISDFVATYMSGDLNIPQLTYTLDTTLLIRNLTVTMEYDADFVIFGVPVWGAGTFDLVFTDITFNLHTTLAILTFSLSETAIVPNIGAFRGKITGFLHDDEQSWLVTELLNDLLPRWINDQAKDISDYLSPGIETLINEFLQTGGGGGEGGEDGDNIFDLIEQYCPSPVVGNPGM